MSGEVKFIPMLVPVWVGREIPLEGDGTLVPPVRATIVGTFDGKVLGRIDNSPELVEIQGVTMEPFPSA